MSTTFNGQIAALYDDVSSGPSGFWDANYNCNFMGHSSGNGFLNAGLRFTSVTVPKAATIVSAKLSVYAQFNQFFSVDADGIVYGEAADDPATFASGTREPHSLSRTTANVEWSPSVWTDNTWYDSPDLKTIVQEIVNRAGWASGNDMAFLWIQSMDPGYTDDAFVSFTDYNGSTSNCPKLEITYADSAGLHLLNLLRL